MIIFEINSVPYGSTGRIMFQIADTVKSMGGTAYTSASFTKSRGEHFTRMHYKIGGAIGKTAHIMLAKCTGRHGCYSHFATHRLIQKIKQVNPDVMVSKLENAVQLFKNSRNSRYLDTARLLVVYRALPAFCGC